jgi:NitT/TauT family transport system ATP-binding protein
MTLSDRSATLIKARDLALVYPSSRGGVNLAIREVDITVRRGEIAVLIGPSGCGKSTFLNVVAGLLPASFGSVTYGGKPITKVNDRVGYITQKDNLLPWRTVAKNVEIGLEIQGVPRGPRAARVASALKLVGMEDAADRYPAQLSGGMRSRASLARTLVLDPETLLMDEPFAALDAQRRMNLQTELLRIKESTGVTVLFVTHDLDEAILIADRIFVFTPGPAGRIRSTYEVEIEHPRQIKELRGDPRYAELWAGLWRDLDPENKVDAS